MKKLELCAPVELVEPVRTELAAGGIVTSAVTVSCALLNVGNITAPGRKSPKARKTSYCKVELVVSDRLASRAVEIISNLLLTSKLDVPAGRLVVLGVDDNYDFEGLELTSTT